tara:strand:- start:86 stop:1105 length:1020 start_codon:yes stop_codon:yes gene_type:complete
MAKHIMTMAFKSDLYLNQVSKILADYSGLYADSLPIELICRYIRNNGASPMSLALKEIKLAKFIDNHFFPEFGLNHFNRKIELILNRAIVAKEALKETNEWLQLRNADDYVDFFAEATALSKTLSRDKLFIELAQHPFLPFHENSLKEELTKATDVWHNVRSTFNPILRILIWQLKECASNNGDDYDILDMIDDTFNYDIIRFLKALKASKTDRRGKTESYYKKIKLINPNPDRYPRMDKYNDYRHGSTCSGDGLDFSLVGFYTPEYAHLEGDCFTRRSKSVKDLTFNTAYPSFSIRNKNITKAWCQSYLRKNNVKYTTKMTRKQLIKLCYTFPDAVLG